MSYRDPAFATFDTIVGITALIIAIIFLTLAVVDYHYSNVRKLNCEKACKHYRVRECNPKSAVCTTEKEDVLQIVKF